MPPRYAFWTILIDQKPTAFRAREQSELLPTLAQLRRTNSDVLLKWFARGRLWDSPEQEREAQQKPAPVERRTREWRPGGAHKDPRARFQKKKGPRPASFRPPDGRPPSGRPPSGRPPGDRPLDRPRSSRPPDGRPPGRPRGSRPPGGSRGPRGPRGPKR